MDKSVWGGGEGASIRAPFFPSPHPPPLLSITAAVSMPCAASTTRDVPPALTSARDIMRERESGRKPLRGGRVHVHVHVHVHMHVHVMCLWVPVWVWLCKVALRVSVGLIEQ